MKKPVFLCCLFFLSFLYAPAMAQDAMVMLKFEEAERAFNDGNYNKAIEHLDEVEKLAGVTSKTLYLRIVSENKLFNNGAGLYEDEQQFNRLLNLRVNAKAYLDAMSTQGLDDKYRDVYRIQESLAGFPGDKQAWRDGRTAMLREREAQRLQQLEKERAERQRQKQIEYTQLQAEHLSVHDARYHPVAQRVKEGTAGMATVYFIRPEEQRKDMPQSLILNEEVMINKMKPGQYVKMRFDSGLLRVGVVDIENYQRVSSEKRTASLLMGGVIGLVATSGKIAAKNEQPFLFHLERGETYYITTNVTKDKTIAYAHVQEPSARAYMKGCKEIQPD